MSPEVVVVGLGSAGLPLALVLAEAGWQVVGVDADPARVRVLREQPCADGEAAVSELLAKHRGRGLTVTSTMPVGARAYVIAVATPVEVDGAPDLVDLRTACEHARVGSLVVLRSTVPPGTTRQVVAPLLARAAGGSHPGVDFHLAFAPERAVQGAAIQELRRLPQLLAGLSEACFAAAVDVFSFARCIYPRNLIPGAESRRGWPVPEEGLGDAGQRRRRARSGCRAACGGPSSQRLHAGVRGRAGLLRGHGERLGAGPSSGGEDTGR